jgi:cytochrome P450
MMPHSFLFGHLISVGKVVSKYPTGTGNLGSALLLAKEYPELGECGIIYMDTWPIAPPTLAVFHPDVMAQFTQETSMPKGDFIKPELYPLTQSKDLVSSEGAEWKTWRSIFNPGFSAKNLTSLLPAFLEEIQVIRERFIKLAESGEIVELEPVVQKLTIDVICRAVL